jgi:hypothetical protein
MDQLFVFLLAAVQCIIYFCSFVTNHVESNGWEVIYKPNNFDHQWQLFLTPYDDIIYASLVFKFISLFYCAYVIMVTVPEKARERRRKEKLALEAA